MFAQNSEHSETFDSRTELSSIRYRSGPAESARQSGSYVLILFSPKRSFDQQNAIAKCQRNCDSRTYRPRCTLSFVLLRETTTKYVDSRVERAAETYTRRAVQPWSKRSTLTFSGFQKEQRNDNLKTRMLRIKSVWPYAVHAKDFLAISENLENFHIELANQPVLS